jgi:hypothetical protein
VRDAGHAQARLVELAAGLGQAFPEDCHRLRVKLQRDAEGLRHAIRGDVVMRRPDAAGGEHIGVFRAQTVERFHDRRGVIGNDADLLQVDANGSEVIGDIADVLVLGPTREDFVANHQHGSGDDVGLGTHGVVLTGGPMT